MVWDAFEMTKAGIGLFERQYNRAPQGTSLQQLRLDRLSQLRLGTPLTECGSADQAPTGEVVALKTHINNHWFGRDVDPSTGAPSAPQSAHTPGSTTGWWLNWYGDAEGILREGLIRAIEVSLGLNHGDSEPPPGKAWRLWPIEWIWVCDTSRFQAFVTWANHGATGARVTFALVTPGMADPASPGQPYELYRNVTATAPAEIDRAVTGGPAVDGDAAGFLVVSKSLDADEPVPGSSDVIKIQDSQPVTAQLLGVDDGGVAPNLTPDDLFLA